MSTLDGASLHRFLEQFTDTFTPELADQFANLPPSSEVQLLCFASRQGASR